MRLERWFYTVPLRLRSLWLVIGVLAAYQRAVRMLPPAGDRVKGCCGGVTPSWRRRHARPATGTR